MRAQLACVERELAAQEQLRARLQQIERALEAGTAPPTSDVIKAIEVMTMTERYYTPEQREQLAERRRALGDDGLRAAEREWAQLIEDVERERSAGTEPSDPRVQQLAARWRELIERFTGGDSGIRDSLKRMYRDEGPERASRGAIDAELMQYMDRAFSESG